MALQINKEVKGITKDWYIKTLSFKGTNKGNTIATYGYFCSSTEATDVNNAIELEQINFNSVANIDILEQAYTALKNTDEFTNAVDC